MKQLSKNNIRAVGLMSGTSLDGLDLVAAEFFYSGTSWSYKIHAAETIHYLYEWIDRLATGHLLSGENLIRLHVEYGRWLGIQTKKFIQKTGFEPDLIASHGHTIFHQPENHYTFQAGSGFEIASETGIITIADFRSADIAFGGQGAPLVPVGDKLLFDQYDYCLNLGGFANISYNENQKRIAYDICPVNFILNYFARKSGYEFDKNGKLGRSGLINQSLLDCLNAIDYYSCMPPKSLGREWVEMVLLPILKEVTIPENNIIRTIYEHIALQIVKSTSVFDSKKILVTGGGAFNGFLIERIRALTNNELIIPDFETVCFKEALVFAFLGTLRILDINNCLSSVTGSLRDHCAGVIYRV